LLQLPLLQAVDTITILLLISRRTASAVEPTTFITASSASAFTSKRVSVATSSPKSSSASAATASTEIQDDIDQRQRRAEDVEAEYDLGANDEAIDNPERVAHEAGTTQLDWDGGGRPCLQHALDGLEVRRVQQEAAAALIQPMMLATVLRFWLVARSRPSTAYVVLSPVKLSANATALSWRGAPHQFPKNQNKHQ
jgi:hypothetical protein